MASNADIRKWCKICHEVYVDPHVLQCGHSFCRVCINGITKPCLGNKTQSITCPLCHATSSSTQKNYALSELLELEEQMPKLQLTEDQENEGQQADRGYQQYKTSLQQIGQKQWKQKEAIILDKATNNIRLIDGELWLCHQDGCAVYTLDLKTFREIKFARTDKTQRLTDSSIVYDIAKEANNSLIVASQSGLWRCFADGLYQKRESGTAHIDICVSTRGVFYATKTDLHMINMLGEKYCLTTLSDQKRGIFRYGERNLTVAPLENAIVICNSAEGKVECLSMDCEITSQPNDIKTCYSNIKYGKKVCTDGVVLRNPFICCSDPGGNVLIADCSKDRLLLRRPEGKYEELDLQPPVIAPNSAVYYDDKLFVVNCHHQTLHLYECGSDK